MVGLRVAQWAEATVVPTVGYLVDLMVEPLAGRMVVPTVVRMEQKSAANWADYSAVLTASNSVDQTAAMMESNWAGWSAVNSAGRTDVMKVALLEHVSVDVSVVCLAA